MEAILDKRRATMTGRWAPRLFRFRDRRLMYWKKDILDFEKAIDSSAKYILDLTHLSSLSIDKKHDLVFTLRHPMLDLELRFKTNELFVSWLKVLSSFSFTKVRNGPKIETSIPSNYLYSIWNILQSLYTHPSLTKVEGIFRISGNKAERSLVFNQLLQQTYDVQKLQQQSNIHILANVLSALLSNLPSSLFKEQQIGHLIQFYDAISHRNPDNTTSLAHLFTKQAQSSAHADQEVADISVEILNRLKAKIEELYYTDVRDRSRYGLMTLVFHLLKQIVIHQQRTRMTAENISRIFVHVMESKIFLIKCTDPIQMYRMQYLLKTLIYHAYFIFPHQKWDIEDIVVASKGEITMIYKIDQLRKKRKIKPSALSRPGSARNMFGNNTKFISHFKNPVADTESKSQDEDEEDEVMSVISCTHTVQFDDSHIEKKRPPRRSRHTRYNSDTLLMRAAPSPFQNVLVVPSSSALAEDSESDGATLPLTTQKRKKVMRAPRAPPNKALPQVPMSKVQQWKRNNKHQNHHNANNHNYHGATLESPRRHRADGVSKAKAQERKNRKKKFKKRQRTNQPVMQSDIPAPPPPPPPPPPFPVSAESGTALYNMMANGRTERKREGTIITPATSCCTLLGCSCTNFMESNWRKMECMFCNHSKEAHNARIWM